MPGIKPLPRDTMTAIGEAVDGAYGSLGGISRPPHLAEVLDQNWPPDCATSDISGKLLARPEDAERLEKLFKLFGVPILVKDNSAQIIGRAYDVFGQALSLFVNQKLRFPTNFGQCESFREYLSAWPDDWVKYIEAVAAEDFEESRRLAKKLKVLDPDCEYPDGTFVPPPVPYSPVKK